MYCKVLVNDCMFVSHNSYCNKVLRISRKINNPLFRILNYSGANRKQKKKMKTQLALSKILLITGLIFTTLLAVSKNTTPSAALVSNETEKTIRNYFRFPQILLPHYESKTTKENKVQVLFTTDKNGKVNFVLVKTGNEKLKKEIEKQFSNLRLSKLKSNVVHSVVLNFKTL